MIKYAGVEMNWTRRCGYAAAAVIVAMLFVSGCGGQLRRTNNTEWKLHTLSDIGIQIEVPAAAEVESDLSFGLVVRMHALSPPSFTLADTQYLLVLRTKRAKETELADQLQLLKDNVPRTRENEWRYWMTERHAAIAVSDHGEYSYYRYDRDCVGGVVLRADVELRHLSTPVFDSDDDRTIRRMLQSLRCVDDRV